MPGEPVSASVVSEDCVRVFDANGMTVGQVSFPRCQSALLNGSHLIVNTSDGKVVTYEMSRNGTYLQQSIRG